MEAAIRWSAQSSPTSRRFLIADVSANRLQYCQVKSVNEDTGRVKFKVVSYREKLPNFTAFDWSRDDENLVAIGTSNGETRLMSLNSQDSGTDVDQSFPVKSQRKCNSLAFNRTHLLATGLDRIRGNDSSLNIYDLNSQTTGSSRAEPYRKLIASGSEVITNVKFFRDQPQTLMAGSGGVARHAGGQNIKIYDLREASPVAAAASFMTKHVHFLSIDALDENYFASASPSDENAVSVWDRRAATRSTAATAGESQASAVLEIQPTVDASQGGAIWSLRYSGYQRGVFAVLSSMGQVKLFETTKFTARYGSSEAWPMHYVKKTSNLEYPFYDRSYGLNGNESHRAIAFDFATPGHLHQGPCVLSLRQDRSLQTIKLPTRAVRLDVSAANDMVLVQSKFHTLARGGNEVNIADDLIKAQTEVEESVLRKSQANGATPEKGRQEKDGAPNARSDSLANSIRLDSRKRHQKLHYPALSGFKIPIELAMMIQDSSRSRCLEGYLFDCAKNKEIVRNDPWLVEMWDIIGRLDRMASNGGMMYQTMDFSFLGVAAIWRGDIVTFTTKSQKRMAASKRDCASAVTYILQRHGYGSFSGPPADENEYPSLRQIGLAICGWRFSENALRDKCDKILARKDYYKAIIVAVCHDRRDIAIQILKRLSHDKSLENAGSLAALIAIERLDTPQREMCAWTAEEAEDPYLRALLTHLISGSWTAVIDMTELPLTYRVALALKYLSDTELTSFLTLATEAAISHGDPEGIILTGLSHPSSIDLFANYIANFNDIQSAVLALAFAVPRFIKSDRFDAWKETYFASMQTWRAFIERSRFSTRHTRMAASRDPPAAAAATIPVPENQTMLRCRHCNASLARRPPVNGHAPNNTAQSAASTTTSATGTPNLPADNDDDATSLPSASTTLTRKNPRARDLPPAPDSAHACPSCGRKLSRCALCLKWQGSSASALSNSSGGGMASSLVSSATKSGTNAAPAKPNKKTDNSSELMEAFLAWCRRCGHGYHAKCAGEWFAGGSAGAGAGASSALVRKSGVGTSLVAAGAGSGPGEVNDVGGGIGGRGCAVPGCECICFVR